MEVQITKENQEKEAVTVDLELTLPDLNTTVAQE
jgi:hypothetical protein